MRVRYKYKEVSAYRSWDVLGVGQIVSIKNRRPLQIEICSPSSSFSNKLVKRIEIEKILKPYKKFKGISVRE
ncbi:MAG: hypothetical protein WCT51_04860 [Candidatus Shapirobacteria bacterium]